MERGDPEAMHRWPGESEVCFPPACFCVSSWLGSVALMLSGISVALRKFLLVFLFDWSDGSPLHGSNRE